MTEKIVDPFNGETFLKMPSTSTKEIEPFTQSLRQTPKYGLHNPLNNAERYVLYGDISHKAAAMLRDPQVADFFHTTYPTSLTQSYTQAETEVIVTEKFTENFGGDQVRFGQVDWSSRSLVPMCMSKIMLHGRVTSLDAYAYSGQKCSAQSTLFMHQNWVDVGIEEKLVLTVTTERMLGRVETLLKIPGARLSFGGKELENHSISKVYGAIRPTAVFVPLEEILEKENFELYSDDQLDLVLQFLEKMHARLTAAVVSNDDLFRRKVLARSVNGTIYAGIRARTTGAPQNHCLVLLEILAQVESGRLKLSSLFEPVIVKLFKTLDQFQKLGRFQKQHEDSMKIISTQF
ncbi:unnamed protein product [Albugo candida]|uniref:Uncharacterized protein n=1 Tax=Albugo candida TaxID=65357 RepID=A0A024G3D2_9STRA|nr:unnamed protein product [Albugo candida]|eukprot:CCI41062.1 unnamed protein product [Albugo candida]